MACSCLSFRFLHKRYFLRKAFQAISCHALSHPFPGFTFLCGPQVSRNLWYVISVHRLCLQLQSDPWEAVPSIAFSAPSLHIDQCLEHISRCTTNPFGRMSEFSPAPVTVPPVSEPASSRRGNSRDGMSTAAWNLPTQKKTRKLSVSLASAPTRLSSF